MIHSITPNLMVSSVEESVAFYTKIGFTEVTSVPDPSTGNLQFAIVGRDAAMIMFQERSNLIAEYPALAGTSGPSITLFVKVDDAAALAAQLKGTIPFEVELHKTFYGADEFAILDNSGYVITFAQT
jgi:predicted lactoylglutathione lyase